MKKLLALLLVLCFVLVAFAGCGKKEESPVGPYDVDSSSSQTDSLKDSDEAGQITGDIEVEIVPAGDESSSGEYFPGYW